MPVSPIGDDQLAASVVGFLSELKWYERIAIYSCVIALGVALTIAEKTKRSL